MMSNLIFQISFVVALLIMLVIGIWGYKKTITADDYFAAGRSLGPFLSTAAFAGAYTSAATVLGIIGLNYGFGIQYFTGLNIGIPLGLLIMVVLFLRPLRNFAGYTLSDVFSDRFDKNYGSFSGALIGLAYVVLLVPQFLGGSITLTLLLGMSMKIAVIIMGLVMIIYVVLGGVRAVAATDAFQYFILFGTVVIAGIYVIFKYGGVTDIVSSAYKVAPQNFAPFGAYVKNPLYMIGLTLSWVLGGAAQPYIIMRAFSANTVRTAEKMARNFAGLQIINIFLLFIVAMAAISLVPKGTLDSADKVFPYLLKNTFSPVVGVLLLMGILGAILSTTDTILFTIGASITNNVAKRFYPKMTDQSMIFVSRITITVAGLIAIFIAMNPPGMISIIMGEIFGFIGCCFFVPLFATFYSRRATKEGAWASTLGGGILYILWKIYAPLTIKAYIHPTVAGIILATVLMVVVSNAFPKPDENIVNRFAGYCK
jgi:SSS family transporter